MRITEEDSLKKTPLMESHGKNRLGYVVWESSKFNPYSLSTETEIPTV